MASVFLAETFGHIVREAYSCLLVDHVSHFLWPIWQLCQAEANSFYFTFDFSEACSFQLFNVLKIVAFCCRAAFLCTSKHFFSLSLFARQAILSLFLSCHHALCSVNHAFGQFYCPFVQSKEIVSEKKRGN